MEQNVLNYLLNFFTEAISSFYKKKCALCRKCFDLYPYWMLKENLSVQLQIQLFLIYKISL